MPPELTREQRRRYAALAPWKSPLGGDPGDLRADLCAAVFGPRLGRVLELSCLEGGHTHRLAARADSVLSLDARPGNAGRTRLCCEVAGAANVEVRVADLDDADLTPLGRFDVVFCSGVLYHVEAPWRLLRQCAAVSDRLFLWSHYTPDPLPDGRMGLTVAGGYRGRWQGEDGNSTTSGIAERSWWFTRADLLRAVADAGFAGVRVLAENPWHPWDTYVVLACTGGVP